MYLLRTMYNIEIYTQINYVRIFHTYCSERRCQHTNWLCTRQCLRKAHQNQILLALVTKGFQTGRLGPGSHSATLGSILWPSCCSANVHETVDANLNRLNS